MATFETPDWNLGGQPDYDSIINAAVRGIAASTCVSAYDCCHVQMLAAQAQLALALRNDGFAVVNP